MRATIKNYIEAVQKRRQEEGEEGFSLIELIVVVAILGILVAIAIPVFTSIQGTAQDNALKAAAANGASVVAAAIANGDTPADADLDSLESGDIDEVTLVENKNTSLTDICVQAMGFGGKTQTAGNGCDD